MKKIVMIGLLVVPARSRAAYEHVRVRALTGTMPLTQSPFAATSLRVPPHVAAVPALVISDGVRTSEVIELHPAARAVASPAEMPAPADGEPAATVIAAMAEPTPVDLLSDAGPTGAVVLDRLRIRIRVPDVVFDGTRPDQRSEEAPPSVPDVLASQYAARINAAVGIADSDLRDRAIELIAFDTKMKPSVADIERLMSLVSDRDVLSTLPRRWWREIEPVGMAAVIAKRGRDVATMTMLFKRWINAHTDRWQL